MPPNTEVRWGRTGSQVEPPEVKKDAGNKSGRPEAAQYLNWMFDRFGAGASLDRLDDSLLYMPLYNSLDVERGVGTVAFTRSTLATYLDRYGVIRNAAADVPRFEQNGLLMEGASTNLLLRSQEFETSAWAKNDCTITPDDIAAPTGSVNADKMAANSTGNFFIFNTVTATTADKTFTFSVWLKHGTFTKNINLRIREGDGSGDVSILITTLTTEWQRFEVTKTFPSDAVANVQCFIDPVTDHSSGDYFYVWGAQFEELPFPSSYMHTAGSTVTRTTDECSITPTDNVPLQANTMAFLADIDLLGHNAQNQYVFRVVGETNRIIQAQRASSSDRLHLFYGDQNVTSGQKLNAGQTYRVGLTHDGAGVASVWIDGVKKATAPTADVSESLGTFIGIGTPSDQLFGHITNFRIYDRALTDQEMSVA